MVIKKLFLAFCFCLTTVYCFGDNPGGITVTPSIWFDAEDSSTIVTANDLVVSWINKGAMDTATQSVTANQPLFVDNVINSHSVVRFDGTDDFLNANLSALNNTNYSIFVIEKRASSGVSSYIMGTPMGPGLPDFFGYSNTNWFTMGQLSNICYYPYNGNTGEIRLWNGLFNSGYPTGSKHRIYLSGDLKALGVQTGGDDTIGLTAGSGFIGCTISSGSASYSGDLAEIIVYNSGLATENINAINNSLANKWNIPITLNIDIRTTADYDFIILNDYYSIPTGNLVINSFASLTTENTFTILRGPNIYLGRFYSIKLPTLNAGLAWNLKDLYTSGQISIMGVPGSISEKPLIWLDASDSGSVCLVSANVSTWVDKTGNNYSGIGSTSNIADTPIYLPSGNALGSLDFSDNNYLIVSNNAFDSLRAHTMMVVFKRDAAETDAAVFGRNYNYGFAIIRFFGSQLGYEVGNINLSLDSFISFPSPPTSNLILVTGEFNPTTTLQQIFAYSEYVSSNILGGNILPDARDQAAIGRYMDVSGNGQRSLDGEISEIILYNTALSTSNRLSVENSLANKWGFLVTANLDIRGVTDNDTIIMNDVYSKPTGNLTITESWAYAPTTSTSFQVLSGSQIGNGSFSSVSVPGTNWDISALYTTGIITYTPAARIKATGKINFSGNVNL
jgi:hypothetical protein